MRAGSVPWLRRTLYCSGDNWARHSASDLEIFAGGALSLVIGQSLHKLVGSPIYARNGDGVTGLGQKRLSPTFQIISIKDSTKISSGVTWHRQAIASTPAALALAKPRAYAGSMSPATLKRRASGR